MTYEEVENILGKPDNISRGETQLEIDQINQIENINRSVEAASNSFIRWDMNKTIKSVGSLIYVSWLYKDLRLDTCYIAADEYKEVFDTSYTTKKNYYIGDLKVTKKQYNAHTGILYLSPYLGQIINKKEHDHFRKFGNKQLAPPKKVKKRIVNKKIPRISSNIIFDKTEKLYFEITNVKTIIFDAASGRVTEDGYFPLLKKTIYIDE